MECPVCLDTDIDARACKLRCGHHLCNHCIVKLQRPLCPSCRRPIFPVPAADPPPPAPATAPGGLDTHYFDDPSLMDAAGPHMYMPALHAPPPPRDGAG